MYNQSFSVCIPLYDQLLTFYYHYDIIIYYREIDRVFKKVKEGLEVFDFIYTKLQDTDNQSQKEKFESDLKKEIKRLQRFREQIKNWMSGTEVKDKKPLIEHRKLIEREMERFKEVEKMMKTKAFSNEALASTNEIIDPRMKEKMETAEFIQNNIEELQRQMESVEAEIDNIMSTLKKKKSDSAKQSQILQLQKILERHQWHITMLESILRHLENDNLDVDQINDIRDDIEYYVESNQDPNFIEDDTFYDVLGLDDIEDSFAVIPVDDSDITSRSHSVNDAMINDAMKDKEKEKEKEKERLEKEKERERERLEKEKLKKEKEKEKLKSSIDTESAKPSASNVLLNGNLKVATPIGTPKLKYASAVLSGIKKSNPSTPSNVPIQLSSTPLQASVQTPTPISYATLASAVQSAHKSQAQAQAQAQANSQTHTPQPTSKGLSPSTVNKTTVTTTTTTTTTTVTTTTQNPSTNSGNKESYDSNTGITSSTLSSTTNSSVENNQLSQIDLNNIESIASFRSKKILNNNSFKLPHINGIEESLSFLNSDNYNNLPSGIDSYLKSLEVAKDRIFKFKKPDELHVPSKKSQPPPMICEFKLPKLEDISIFLENSLLNCPDSFDSDKPHNYIPCNPYVTQPSFPIDPLPEIVGSTKLLKNVSLDTLFYGFYYNNLRSPSMLTSFHNLKHNDDDDYLQIIIAKELHRRGWNYKASTHTWFTKDNDDGLSNGDSSITHWKTFDYKDTWMVRRNPNFQIDVSDIETGYY